MDTYHKVEYPKVNKDYIQQLIDYLCEQYFTESGRLLDIGCGLGHHMEAFAKNGFIVEGVDKECNLEYMLLPYHDKSFDYVFSKSFLEHVHNTENVLTETHRVLNKGGKALFLVPDWTRQIKCFWDDSTHIKPFTQWGLKQAFWLAGFKDVTCQYFYQLPFVWRHPYLMFIPHIIQHLVPDRYKWKDRRNGKQNILIRHSKERMLLCYARK